ncbi:MAG: hypothetical protein L0Y73_02265 [Candidatus Aminicenantes bacterium]|nr:hypothetical protein [Candidatus Aminicenantes bacterium]
MDDLFTVASEYLLKTIAPQLDGSLAPFPGIRPIEEETILLFPDVTPDEEGKPV